jgi:hypothetical protein
LVLETNIARFLLGVVVGEIVPEHTSLVLDKTDIGGYVGGVVLDQRATVSFPRNVEHPPDLDEAGKAPIAFFLGEAVVRGMVDV